MIFVWCGLAYLGVGVLINLGVGYSYWRNGEDITGEHIVPILAILAGWPFFAVFIVSDWFRDLKLDKVVLIRGSKSAKVFKELSKKD